MVLYGILRVKVKIGQRRFEHSIHSIHSTAGLGHLVQTPGIWKCQKHPIKWQQSEDEPVIYNIVTISYLYTPGLLIGIVSLPARCVSTFIKLVVPKDNDMTDNER